MFGTLAEKNDEFRRPRPKKKRRVQRVLFKR